MLVCQSICTVTATPPSKREDISFTTSWTWNGLTFALPNGTLANVMPPEAWKVLWTSLVVRGWLHISSARDTGLIPSQGTKVRHATWCGQVFLLKSAWLWKFALSCCSWNLLPLCEGENKPELACWVVKGMCAQLPLPCQSPAQSHLADWQGTAGTWVSKETPAGPSSWAQPTLQTPELGTNEMAVALPKPLNAGVLCYTEKSSLCIFLLPFLFIFLSLSSYLSSLSLFPPCFLLFSFPSASTSSTHLRTHKAQKTVAWAGSIQR